MDLPQASPVIRLLHLARPQGAQQRGQRAGEFCGAEAPALAGRIVTGMLALSCAAHGLSSIQALTVELGAALYWRADRNLEKKWFGSKSSCLLW